MGWWNDKTKGYYLKDFENGAGKIITFWDVKFIEDNSFSDFIVVDIHGMTVTLDEIDYSVISTSAEKSIILRTSTLNISEIK